MSRRDDQSRQRWASALGLSLCVHLGLFAGAGAALDFTPPDPAPPATQRPMRAVPILSEDDVDRLIAAAQRAPKPKKKAPKPEEKKEEEEKKKPPQKPDGQVVEIPPPPREEVPDDARFVSDYNSKVDKEMVASANRPPQPRMMKSDRKVLSPGQDEQGTTKARPSKQRPKKPKRVAKDKRPGDAARPGAKPGPAPTPGRARPKVANPENKPLPTGDGPFKPSEVQAEPEVARPGGGGEVGGAEAPEHWTGLLPTLGPKEMAKQEGSIDHTDLDKGDTTFLNSRDYKYAWFFNRVKRGVWKRWRAVEAHRRNDPYGRVYGVRDRRTVVEVTLDSDGSLEDIVVTQDSGVAFLDEAAVAAFQDAQPFPNPPDGLKDADGRIRFRFAFFLEINSRGMRFLPSRPFR